MAELRIVADDESMDAMAVAALVSAGTPFALAALNRVAIVRLKGRASDLEDVNDAARPAAGQLESQA